MANNLPSATHVYKEDNLKEIQLNNFEEAWELLQNDETTKQVSKDEILRMKIYNNNILYVITVFEGEVFEHLRSIKARIISTHCLVHSHRGNRRLPRPKINPLYSVSMTNLVICCTNIEKNMRQEIYDKVEMMNGKTSRVFTPEVTHLITTEVGSAKYHAAGDMKKPIMLPTWVTDVWDMSIEHDVNAGDENIIDKYRCPIFNKYVICASGFQADVKNEIKKLVESEGGIYKGDLVFGTSTHLVTNEAKGEKYKHAKLWKLSIVSSKWIYDSIEAKYCLPEKSYNLEATASTSTPTQNKSILGTKTKSSKLDNIDISMIANTTARNLVNETEDARFSTTHAVNLDNTTLAPQNTNISKYSDILKELNNIGKIKSILFDGFGIYCDGFDSNINEKLKKLFNSGGAIRFDDFNFDVTHVIVNQLNEKKCKNYVETNPEVNILSIDWVIDTCKQNEIADYKNYFVYNNALNSVKTPKKRTREEKSIGNVSVNISMKSYENDLNNYLSQYLTKDYDSNPKPVSTTTTTTTSTTTTTTTTTTSIPNSVSTNKNDNQNDKQRSVLQEADLNQISAVGVTMNHQQSIGNNSSLQLINAEKAVAQKLLLSNKSFTILGFEVDEINELKALIESMGGKVNEFYDDDNDEEIDENYYLSKGADYVLLPMTITEPLNIAQTTTVYWLRKCIEQNCLLDLNENVLFQPIPRFNTDRALTGCVVTISGYISYEKETISSLCQLVGAVTQSAFSSKRAKDIYPNTHLICKTADGPKYTAAKSWKIPAVSIEWLIDSCVSGVKADENKYSIDSGSKYEDFIKNLDKIRRNITESQQNQSTILNEDPNTTSSNDRSITVLPFADKFGTPTSNNNNNNNDMTVDFESPKDNNQANDSSLLGYSASKKPRLDNSNYQDNETSILEPKKSSNDFVFKTPQAVEMLSNRKSLNNKTPIIRSQDAPSCNPRFQQIKQMDIQSSYYNTPSNSSMNGANASMNWQTPLWLKSPNDPKLQNFECRLNVNVDVDKVMELLRTPNPNGGEPLTPLHDVVVRSFKKANENAKIPGFYDFSSDSPEIVYSFEKKKLAAEKMQNYENNYDNNQNDDDDDDGIPPTPIEVKEMKEILKNVKVYVSKKLAKNQAELNNIVETLGGDFIWIYNQSCTHVIYSGKANDNNKELRLAKEQNKTIVSPYWLYACQEQKQRVDESLYPYTYNPSKCAVVTSRTPKVSLANDKPQVTGTPVSVNKEIRASQQIPPRSQMKKTTVQNIIKNYCSDEDDEDENDEENLLAATNQANFRLLKKKTNSNNNNMAFNDNAIGTTVPDTNKLEPENDSEMNLIDSQFIRNCDKECNKNNKKSSEVAEIPDSIDIKNDFLNQLQDKLANIRTSNTTSNSNNGLNMTPGNIGNLNTSSHSMLNEYQIMNELNKSGRSKWGNSVNHDLHDNNKKSSDNERNEDDDFLQVRINDDNNSSYTYNDEDIEKLKQLNINKQQKQQKYNIGTNSNKINDIKKRRQFNKGDNDNDDDDDLSGNLNHVAPSQIQVTLWKEEHQTIRRKNENMSDRLNNYHKN